MGDLGKIIREWEDGRFKGSKARLVVDDHNEELVIQQLGRDEHWYYIDSVESYSPFVDLIYELLGIEDV